jgi:hypothetical protein
MTHEEIQDRLEAYVDDRLTRDERREVDAHLKECDECRAILDGVAPVDMAALGPMTYDEAAMKRTVRRSMFRTAFNTALLLVAGWIVLWFLAVFVVQPLAVNRGGRVADAVRMSIDLPMMAHPGAAMIDGRIESGTLTRVVSLDFALPVGAGFEPGVRTSTSIGVFGIASLPIEDSPIEALAEFQGQIHDQLANLGEGTVATIAVSYPAPISIERAQEIADDPGADIRVVWAGFDATRGREEGPAWTSGGTLGYGTCRADDMLDDEILGATSAGFGGGSNFRPSSVERALESVIAALVNIESRQELVDYVVGRFNDDPDDVSAILTALRSNPEVTTLVVTGPSNEVAAFLASETGVDASMLAVDFYNWTSGICGR